MIKIYQILVAHLIDYVPLFLGRSSSLFCDASTGQNLAVNFMCLFIIVYVEVYMGVETIGSGMDVNPHLVDGIMDDNDQDTSFKGMHNLDARRRLENKIEELRLQREMQDFDFD